MLLLAPDLLAIVLCLGSVRSKLGFVDTTTWLVFGKIYGAARATVTA